MALLLLLSTTSWKLEKHYCMGQLINIAVFVDVADCGMNMVHDDELNLNGNESDDSCCNDDVFFVKGQDDLQMSWNLLDIVHQHFLIAFVYSYLIIESVQTGQSVANEQYPPPLLVKDLQLLDEVYLI